MVLESHRCLTNLIDNGLSFGKKIKIITKKTINAVIILVDDDGTAEGIHPRWGKVYAVGRLQEDVKVGQWIMVAHGRWSRAFKVKRSEKGSAGEIGVELEVRMIDENDILLVSDDEPDFNRHKAGYVNTGGMQQMTSLPGND